MNESSANELRKFSAEQIHKGFCLARQIKPLEDLLIIDNPVP